MTPSRILGHFGESTGGAVLIEAALVLPVFFAILDFMFGLVFSELQRGSMGRALNETVRIAAEADREGLSRTNADLAILGAFLTTAGQPSTSSYRIVVSRYSIGTTGPTLEWTCQAGGFDPTPDAPQIVISGGVLTLPGSVPLGPGDQVFTVEGWESAAVPFTSSTSYGVRALVRNDTP